MGRSDQALLRKVFAGEPQESPLPQTSLSKIRCRERGKIKVRDERFAFGAAGAHWRASQREYRANHADAA